MNEPLLPDNWQMLAPLVDAVLDAPPERRAQLLDELTGGDSAKRAEVERLVLACECAAPLLDRPAVERFEQLLGHVPDALPETLGGRYRIERELGRGGMACVYLARDLKHARNVAVKVIRPDLAASLGRDRFLREIGIAARLRHPNIVPLYDSGDADGVLYFVMPFEEGQSLREWLRRDTTMPVAECVSVLRDVARALAYAHEQGVVHRDIKPDNVMLSGGAAVVTDFGIAKAVSAARAETMAATITQVGVTIGTPAYMAPEQAVGDPSTDHRADLYSFGCLAYELFTGRPPFHDLPSHLLIAAHVGTRPAPITGVRADVPDAVARLIARCLEKSPSDRPQGAQELLSALEGSSTNPVPLASARKVSRRATAAVASLGVVVLTGAAWLATKGPGNPPLLMPGDLTISVMPLNSPAGDERQRDLAEALSDDIANNLYRVPGIRVKSRWGVSNYLGRREFVPAEIAAQLGVRFLVTGSLRESGDRLIVQAQLLNAADNSVLWSDRFEKNRADLGLVRDDITRAIGDTLRHLLRAEFRVASVQPVARVANPEAFAYNILAQTALRKRGASFRTSFDNFERAIQFDSLNAEAYSGRSLAYALAPHLHPTVSQDIPAEIRINAMRALELDPTLAQAHVALAIMYRLTFDWDSAALHYQLASKLRRADDVEPLVQWGIHLTLVGKNEEALTQFRLAQLSEPASAVVSSRLSFAYYLAGKQDSALLESEKAFRDDSTNQTTLTFGAIVRLKAGRLAEAREFARRATQAAPSPPNLWVLIKTGDTATAMQRLRVLERQQPRSPVLESARAYVALGLGDTTRALDALERASRAREIWPFFGSVRDVMFEPIRRSARFERLLESVHFPSVASPPPSRPATP